jgi:hypothetical protein
MRGFSVVYARVSALGVNAFHIGVAPASKTVIGRKPRINSIVRNIEVVLYIVLSIKPSRRVYGEMMYAGDR